MELKQYETVLVNLNPTVGGEIRKTRPCVILSPDEMNRHLRTIVIAPMTTQRKDYPTRVPVHQNGQDGYIVVDQPRAIDRNRILKKLGELTPREITHLKEVIAETYVR